MKLNHRCQIVQEPEVAQGIDQQTAMQNQGKTFVCHFYSQLKTKRQIICKHF